MDQTQPLALALFTGLVGLKVRRRFLRLFGKSGGQDPDEGDEADLADGTESSGHLKPADPPKPAEAAEEIQRAEPAEPTTQPKPKKHKRRVLSWRRVVMSALIGAAILALFQFRELKIGGAFDVLPVQNADVRAQVEGIIEQIYVSEGQVVQQGELIARLSDRDDLAELRKTEAAIAEARAKLKLLEAGPRAEEIVLARASVAKAQENLADRQNELAEAAGKLEVLLAGSRPEDIEATKAQIASLEAQRFYLEEKLQLLKVLSPAAGVVATPSRQLMEMKHQLVRKGDLIAKVFDLKTITAEIVISEK